MVVFISMGHEAKGKAQELREFTFTEADVSKLWVMIFYLFLLSAIICIDR